LWGKEAELCSFCFVRVDPCSGRAMRSAVRFAIPFRGVGGALFGFATLSSGAYCLVAEPRWLFGTASIQGRRSYQEDAFVASAEDGAFAVFDGHGGGMASDTAMKVLFLSQLKVFSLPKKQKVFLQTLKRALALKAANEWDAGDWEGLFRAIEEEYRVVSKGVVDTNGSRRAEGREGSTACALLIRNSMRNSIFFLGVNLEINFVFRFVILIEVIEKIVCVLSFFSWLTLYVCTSNCFV
jgi:serine/threonine protein phosphatase PrpC